MIAYVASFVARTWAGVAVTVPLDAPDPAAVEAALVAALAAGGTWCSRAVLPGTVEVRQRVPAGERGIAGGAERDAVRSVARSAVEAMRAALRARGYTVRSRLPRAAR